MIAGTWPVGRAASAGGLAPAGFDLWTSLAETLREWARAEAGAGRLLPWVPVAFGGGIALYFAADHEPVLWVVAATAIALTLGAVLLRRSRLFAPAIMIAAVAAGFATATWKTARIAHTVLAKPLYSVSLSGFVETRDIRGAPTASCCASPRWRRSAATSSSSACASPCARGLARGRQLRAVEGAAVAAVVAGAPRQL